MLGSPVGVGKDARLIKNQSNSSVTEPVSQDLQLRYKPEERTSIIGTAPSVTSINDLSGNNRNATVTGSINQLTHVAKGNALLRFNYSTSNVVSTGLSTLGSTGLYAGPSDTWEIYLVAQSDGVNGYFMSKATYSNRQIAIGYSNGDLFVNCRGNATFFATGINNQLFTVRVRWDGTSLTIGLMQEGETVFTDVTGTIGTTSALSSEPIIFGSRTNGEGSHVQGEIGEVLVYDTILDTQATTQNEEYFAQTWMNKVFDARVILCGDSIMQGMWDATQTGGSMQSRYGLQHGLYVDVNEEGNNGFTTANYAAAIDSILTSYNTESYPTYCIGHLGTNNVTQTRPYTSQVGSNPIIDDMASNLDTIKSAIEAKGFEMWFGQCPLADYDDTTFVNEQNGAKPYNDNIIEPWIDTKWKYQDGTPVLQFYDLIYNNLSILSSDNIHPSYSGYLTYADYFVSVTGQYLKDGSFPSQLS